MKNKTILVIVLILLDISILVGCIDEEKCEHYYEDEELYSDTETFVGIVKAYSHRYTTAYSYDYGVTNLWIDGYEHSWDTNIQWDSWDGEDALVFYGIYDFNVSEIIRITYTANKTLRTWYDCNDNLIEHDGNLGIISIEYKLVEYEYLDH